MQSGVKSRSALTQRPRKNDPRCTLDFMCYLGSRRQKPGNYHYLCSRWDQAQSLHRRSPSAFSLLGTEGEGPTSRGRVLSLLLNLRKSQERGFPSLGPAAPAGAAGAGGSLPAGGRGGGSPLNREVCRFSGASYQTADVSLSLRVRAANAGTSHNRNAHLWSLSQG